MQKLRLLFFLVFLTTIAIGCGKETDENQNNSSEYYFMLNIDGEKYEVPGIKEGHV